MALTQVQVKLAVCVLRKFYHPATWHTGDHDGLPSDLAAYAIVLKIIYEMIESLFKSHPFFTQTTYVTSWQQNPFTTIVCSRFVPVSLQLKTMPCSCFIPIVQTKLLQAAVFVLFLLVYCYC